MSIHDSTGRPIDRVLERLDNVRQHNGYFMACCPAHDDHEPSLSVDEGDDGRVLLHCFAGCAFENIVAAIDLEPKDLFVEAKLGGGGGLTPRKTVQRCNTPPINRMVMRKTLLQVPMQHPTTVQHPLTRVSTRICGSWGEARPRIAPSTPTPSTRASRLTS